MRRRGTASVAASPTLIGAATVLVVVVAVFLAYNANNGLPFVPTYQLTAQVPDAANLVKGNDVRIGGARVGVVSRIDPKVARNGAVTALLTLKLETRVKPLSRDTSVVVRSRSALGLKYVQLTPGRSPKGFADGATMPLRNATPEPVEIDEFANTFDAKTRRNARRNLVIFSDALVGRGRDLNDAIRALAPLLTNLQPVARNLADPRTALGGFVRSLARTAAEVAPVAETQAALFRNLDTTFGALAGVRPQLQDTISQGPATLDRSVKSFRVQRPFLGNTEQLFADLRPGVRALRESAPTIDSALVAGIRTLPRTVPLSARLARTFVSIRDFSEAPSTTIGINRLTETARVLNPTLAYLTPAQTTCNYVTLWFNNIGSLLSEGDRNGTFQRFIITLTPQGLNNEGSPSSAPANGGPQPQNFLHTNPYPNTGGSPGQNANECEAGNEPWLPGRTVIGNVPGNQGNLHDRTKRDLSTANNTG